MAQERVIIDGNEAAATIAYQLSEVIAIYPITPSSNMGEASDDWAAARKPISGAPSRRWLRCKVKAVLQRRARRAHHWRPVNHVHSSQGLLLMIPNMFKIAGELTPTVFHIAARTVASTRYQFLGDHSDVMAVRSTGLLNWLLVQCRKFLTLPPSLTPPPSNPGTLHSFLRWLSLLPRALRKSRFRPPDVLEGHDG